MYTVHCHGKCLICILNLLSESLDDAVSLLTLRCTGAILAKEQPSVRQDLFRQAWDIVKKKGNSITVNILVLLGKLGGKINPQKIEEIKI